MIARYEPPATGWPWLSLTRWPDDVVQAVRHQALVMARGCHAMEIFERAEAIEAQHDALLDQLAARRTV